MIKKFFILFVPVNLIAESIVVDGNLDEPEWQTAFKITEFYESDPIPLGKQMTRLRHIFSQMKMEFMLVLLTIKMNQQCYQIEQ